MNRLGVHALVWTGGWSEAESRHAIASSKAAGYDYIEIALLDPDSVDPLLTKRLLAEYELAATCSLGLSLDADISSDDPDVAARGEVLLQKALVCAEKIGLTYMVGVLYSALAKYMRPSTPRGREHCVAALKRLAHSASGIGITLGLEVVNRYETNVINTAGEALALLAEIDEPNVGVHLDTYHMNIEEDDMASPVRLCGDKLVYVHIGESHRGYLGSGSVDFAPFFKALLAEKYEGPIAFESFSSAIVSPTLSNTLGVWRNLWTDGNDLAVRAHEFMHAHLR
jgi:D-psicose/D-tagatose/L-ribulose 3-epimerase